MVLLFYSTCNKDLQRLIYWQCLSCQYDPLSLIEPFICKKYFLVNGDCLLLLTDRSSHPEVFLRKGVLKICSKFTEEHPCRSMISKKGYKATLLKSHFGMGVLL